MIVPLADIETEPNAVEGSGMAGDRQGFAAMAHFREERLIRQFQL